MIHTQKFDAIVIGTGFGGSPVACRLAEAGVNTLILERGPWLKPRDFHQNFSLTNLSKYYEPYRSDDFAAMFRVSKVLGGGTITFDGGCLRSPSEVFDYRDRHGHKIWPDAVDRKAMDPYYDKIEEMLRVRRMEWSEIPKTGGLFAKLLADAGLSCDRANFNYGKCRMCGFCETGGCKFGVKVNAIGTYLRQAMKHNADLRTEANVEEIIPMNPGYKVVYSKQGERVEVLADYVFVAGSAIETPKMFFNSKKHFKKFPKKMGKYLNTNGDLSFAFKLPKGIDPDYYVYKGTPNSGVMTYAFWDEHKISIHPGSVPPAIFAACEAHVNRDDLYKRRAFGLDYKYFVKEIYPQRILTAMNIGLVDGEGEVYMKRGQVRINHPKTKTFMKYVNRVDSVMKDFARKSGCELIYYNDRFKFEHGNAHHLATARMGDDPRRSVCDAFGEVRNNEGLYVVDGGAIPGGTGVNPALTIGANAERIVDHFIKNRIQ